MKGDWPNAATRMSALLWENRMLKEALAHARELNVKYEAYPVASPLDMMLHDCGDGECPHCSVLCCPGNHPLHYHHDGCPYCDLAESDRDDLYALEAEEAEMETAP